MIRVLPLLLCLGCATPQLDRTAAMHSQAIAAFELTRDKIIPLMSAAPIPDRGRLYSAATAQLFLCRQTTAQALKAMAGGAPTADARAEAAKLQGDAEAVCLWQPPAAPTPAPAPAAGPQ